MKSIHQLAVAALLALSSASLASAQGLIHVTGSTADRAAAISAEVAIAGGTGSATAVYWGSSLTAANYSIVEGNGWTFENFLNGSVGGDEALVDGVTQLPFPSAATYGPGAAATSANLTTNSPASGGTQEAANPPNPWPGNFAVDTATADILFSDVYNDTALQIIQASSDNTASVATNEANIVDTIVGVTPYVFVNTSTSDIPGATTTGTETTVYGLPGLNIDPQKITYLWDKGTAKLSKFTGLSADESDTVYAIGRDADSGTRAQILAESGFGLNGSGVITQAVKQYYPYVNSGSYTADDAAVNTGSGAAPTYAFNATGGVAGDDSNVTSIGYLQLVPKEGIDGYTQPQGDGGFNTGSSEAKGITTPFNGLTGKVLVGYVGLTDAVTALGRGAQLVSYNGYTFYPSPASYPNGVTTASNAAAIYEGQYTLWGYAHVKYLSTNSNSAVSTAAAAFQTQLVTDQLAGLSSNGVLLSGLKVSRVDDGQTVQ